MAIPLFILAGDLMEKGGLSSYLVEAVDAWIGHLPGGLGIATVLSCALFATMSGSSPATAAAVGSGTIPEHGRAGLRQIVRRWG